MKAGIGLLKSALQRQFTISHSVWKYLVWGFYLFWEEKYIFQHAISVLLATFCNRFLHDLQEIRKQFSTLLLTHGPFLKMFVSNPY